MNKSIGVTSERLGRIVEEAASEVYIFGEPDFYFRLVNRGARDNLGYNSEELSRLTPWDLKPNISRADFLRLIKPLQSGEVDRLDFDTLHQRKDGSTYNVSVKLQLFDTAMTRSSMPPSRIRRIIGGLRPRCEKQPPDLMSY